MQGAEMVSVDEFKYLGQPSKAKDSIKGRWRRDRRLQALEMMSQTKRQEEEVKTRREETKEEF